MKNDDVKNAFHGLGLLFATIRAAVLTVLVMKTAMVYWPALIAFVPSIWIGVGHKSILAAISIRTQLTNLANLALIAAIISDIEPMQRTVGIMVILFVYVFQSYLEWE